MITLRKGDRRSEVRRVQKILNLYEDGIFGVLTEEAVKEFQLSQGLTPDGIVGAKTWAALERYAAQPVPSTPAQPAGVTLKRSINEIILHCSATKDGQSVTTDEIKRWHLQRGFSGIGYHYVVYLDGTVHLGRDVDVSGAHCTGHNSHSIGICYVGGLDKNGKACDTRNEKQCASLLALLKTLRKLYPKAKILGHRDTSPDKNGNGVIDLFERIKDCPCFDAKIIYSHV